MIRRCAELVRVVRHEGIRAADHEKTRARVPRPHQGRRADEVLDPFLAVEATDPTYKGRSVDHTPFSSNHGPMGWIEFRDVDHAGDFERVMRSATHTAGS